MNSEELRQLTGEITKAGSPTDPVTIEQAEKLLAYAQLLSKWAERMDLVSSPNLQRILKEHILDSVGAFKSVSRETSTTGLPFLDIGSGAGLPGVVFAILSSDRAVTLVEPRAKRADFLKECRRELKLKFDVVAKRVEDLTESDISRVSLHGIQRAVGREFENLSYLRENYPGSYLSLLVSTNWRPLGELSSYLMGEALYCAGGREAKIVTLKCFT